MTPVKFTHTCNGYKALIHVSVTFETRPEMNAQLAMAMPPTHSRPHGRTPWHERLSPTRLHPQS